MAVALLPAVLINMRYINPWLFLAASCSEWGANAGMPLFWRAVVIGLLSGHRGVDLPHQRRHGAFAAPLL